MTLQESLKLSFAVKRESKPWLIIMRCSPMSSLVGGFDDLFAEDWVHHELEEIK